MRTPGTPVLPPMRKRAEFLRAARAAKAAMPGLVLQVRRRAAGETGDDDRPRIGYTASRKVGSAVVRNRARRRLRAVVADVLAARARPRHDYVVIARAQTPSRAYDALLLDMGAALDRCEAGGRRKGR